MTIPAGTFTMGSPQEEADSVLALDEHQHDQKRTRSFEMMTTELTQRNWIAAAALPDVVLPGPCDECAFGNANWYDAQWYANLMSEANGYLPCYTLLGCGGQHGDDTFYCEEVEFIGLDCSGDRLPTEAEWEYAYRAGTTTALYNGAITATDTAGCAADPNADEIAWYCDHSGEVPHEVAHKAPNAWGLHDMASNVAEWCWELYADYPTAPVTDPLGPMGTPSEERVLRGGTVVDPPASVRAAARLSAEPGYSAYSGFRLVRTLPPQP